jgi:hypothetical protein
MAVNLPVSSISMVCSVEGAIKERGAGYHQLRCVKASVMVIISTIFCSGECTE